MPLLKFFTKPFRRRIQRIAISLVILGIASSGAGIWLLAEKMVTPRRRATSEWHEKILAAPEEYGLTLSPFTVASTDGTKLEAILVKPTSVPGTAKKRREMERRLSNAGFSTNNKGLVLLIHGRGGIKEDALPITERFVAAGFSAVIFDTRAHGQSGGRFCTYGQLEVDDALAVLEAARDKAGFDETIPTYGFGYSLGASVMIQTLSKTDDITASAVVAPFGDLEQLVIYSGGKFSKRQFPHWMAKSVVRLSELRAGFKCSEIAPLKAATSINEPMFVVHGKLDTVIPIDHGRRIFDAIPHSNKRWLESEDAYHGDVLAKGGDDLYQEILEFYLSSSSQAFRNHSPKIR